MNLTLKNIFKAPVLCFPQRGILQSFPTSAGRWVDTRGKPPWGGRGPGRGFAENFWEMTSESPILGVAPPPPQGWRARLGGWVGGPPPPPPKGIIWAPFLQTASLTHGWLTWSWVSGLWPRTCPAPSVHPKVPGKAFCFLLGAQLPMSGKAKPENGICAIWNSAAVGSSLTPVGSSECQSSLATIWGGGLQPAPFADNPPVEVREGGLRDTPSHPIFNRPLAGNGFEPKKTRASHSKGEKTSQSPPCPKARRGWMGSLEGGPDPPSHLQTKGGPGKWLRFMDWQKAESQAEIGDTYLSF